MVDELPVRPCKIILCLANHAAHRSTYVTDYLRYLKIEVAFLPAYLSPFNCCEYVWSLFKRQWANDVSKITTRYDMNNYERDVRLVIDEVGASLPPNMLRAN